MTENRDRMAGTWLTRREKQLLYRSAEFCGLSISAFLRRAVLNEIGRLVDEGGDLYDERELLDELRATLTHAYKEEQ